MSCPFCELVASGRARQVTAGVYLLRDAYPVSEGHLLIIPSEHVGTIGDLDARLRSKLFEVAAAEGVRLREEGACDDFNIGLNDGPAAGQTVPHAHVHLIPRRAGDTADPRGGVRWILPDKADYWSARG